MSVSTWMRVSSSDTTAGYAQSVLRWRGRIALGFRRMLPRNPPRRVGYLVSRFPVTTQTFILRELNGLAQRGAIEIELFTLFGEDAAGVHSSAAPWLQRVVRPRRSRLGADAAYWSLRKPLAIVRILCAVITDHVLRPAVLARALVTTVYALQHARTVKRLRLDQLHVHFATYPALAAWVIKELTGTPYSVTAHAHDLYIYQDGLARRLREASAVVSISHYNRGFVHAIAGPSVQTPLVRTGLDLGEYSFRAPADTRAGEINVVMVSRFVPSKGHMILLEALADAPAPLSQAKVTFVGDGPLLTEVARRARQLNLDSRLFFMGAQPAEIVRAVLTDSDVLVQPSIIARNGDTEGLPTTLVEAMASGVPVVGTDVTGVPELVHHRVTGLIAKAGDPQSLQDALLVVANDPVLCRKMATAARNRIESEYDSDRSLRALTDVLLSIGTSASSGPSPDRARGMRGVTGAAGRRDLAESDGWQSGC
jgi:colanic acid/amylovoran biosynthesis glycosyltransferase